MNSKDYLKRFPQNDENEHLLKDVGCPVCGQRKKFSLETQGDNGKVTSTITDKEINPSVSDYENGTLECSRCRHKGNFQEFSVPGLDRLITQLWSGGTF
jgi:hypothetical protein